MERKVPIYGLESGVSFVGSRMMEDLLSKEYSDQRARRVVDCLKADCSDTALWSIKMRPEAGHLTFVSFRFLFF